MNIDYKNNQMINRQSADRSTNVQVNQQNQNTQFTQVQVQNNVQNDDLIFQQIISNESIYHMYKSNLFPYFKIKSMVCLIIFIQVIIHITTTLSFGIQKSKSNFLEQKQKTLFVLGNKNPFEIKYNLEFQRFFCSLFLNQNFNQLIYSNILLLILGSCHENFVGSVKFLITYLMTGVFGIVMSTSLTDSINCGQGACLCGIWGAILSYASYLFTNSLFQTLNFSARIISQVSKKYKTSQTEYVWSSHVRS